MTPDFQLVDPQPGAPVVVLDFATEPEPGNVEGKTRCTMCEAWLWLDTDTYPLVSSGTARPICPPCMQDIHEQYPGDVRYAGDASQGYRPLPGL